ncbi:2-oxoglutarate dehydrogenase-like, mitochondrial [Glossina fuscipes fuscipes]
MLKLKIPTYNTILQPLGKRKFWTSFLNIPGSERWDLTSNELPRKQRRFESNNNGGKGGSAAKPAEVSVGSGNSATYVEDMYNAWKRDPGSVHASWNAFFVSGAYECVPPEHTSQRNLVPLSHLCGHNPRSEIIEGHLNTQSVIRSYQVSYFLRQTLLNIGTTL